MAGCSGALGSGSGNKGCDRLPFHVDYSNVTEQYIVSAKICSSVEKCTGTGPGAVASMGALVGTGMVLAVAGVTVSRHKKRNVVGRAGGGSDVWDKA
jgi:hypothetical protein